MLCRNFRRNSMAYFHTMGQEHFPLGNKCLASCSIQVYSLLFCGEPLCTIVFIM